MRTSPEESAWTPLMRAHRAIVVVDVVESVRLMQQHEDDVIDRWRRFVKDMRAEVLPRHGGRLVKSLGDGMLLEFQSAPPAIAAALDAQRCIARYNDGRASDAILQLRIGAHAADIVVDELDIYGSGVNLAARLATLAGAGDIVISPELRDQLIPGFDAELEDLGECDLKGLADPVRAHRVLPRTPASVIAPALGVQSDPRVVIAVLPLLVRPATEEAETLGEIAVDALIHRLSLSPHWRVISRLTSMAFRGRRPTAADVREQLHAGYALSGAGVLSGGRLSLHLELADTANAEVVWGDAISVDARALVEAHAEAVEPIVEAVAAAIFAHEVRRSRMHPLPALRSYTLLFGAVALMHRLSRNDFERSRQLLQHLVERHPHAPEPRAWLAKWHVMNVAQGWSHDPLGQAERAHDMTRRALDEQSDHALALAIDGLAAAFLRGDLDTAQQRYEAALAANPNESLAWLFQSALHTYRDHGAQAAEAAQMALRLSPLDPMRYFFDAFACNAMLAAGRYDEAIALGRRSIRANCTHMPTYRSLAIAQVHAGSVEEARETVARLLKVEPGYTIDEFKRRYAGRDSAHAERYAHALQMAGLPAG